MLKNLIKISQFLDSEDVPKILVTLESFEGESRHGFLAFFQRFVTLERKKEHVEDSKKVVKLLLRKLEKYDGIREAKRLICEQVPGYSDEAAQFLMSENHKLTEYDCHQLYNTIVAKEFGNVDNQNVVEWIERLAASCGILRFSGYSTRSVRKLLLDGLEIGFTSIREISPRNVFSIPDGFLLELMNQCPSHPLLEIEDLKGISSISFVSRCESNTIRCERAIDQFCDFFNSWAMYRDEDAPVFSRLVDRICGMMESMDMEDSRNLGRIAEFWNCAFRLSNGIDLSSTRKMLRSFKLTTELFGVGSRALFLKRVLWLLSKENSFKLGYEPQIVAVIIDTYRKDIRCTEFQEELGEIWSIIYSLRYDNIYNATSYYTSLFSLAKSQALFKIKKNLCAEVWDQILTPIHAQMVDFVRMREAQQQNSVEFGQEENLGAELFDMLVWSYQDTEEAIRKFVQDI